MIVVVAPYSPADRTGQPNLGAARKIEVVISTLCGLGERVVLVNTAHDSETPGSFNVRNSLIAETELLELTPPTYRIKRLGKFINILDASRIADSVLKLGSPTLVWMYNGYAMESRLGLEIKHRTGCHIIQEMEDWHFSRNRGLSPKPLVDWWFWRKAAKKASHVFAVNDPLAARVRPLNDAVSLFPGVVADGIASVPTRRSPFSGPEKSITIGYFGGLSAEKGADLVLGLQKRLPENYRLIVTGSGPLQDAFSKLARTSEQLEFHGRVDDEKLINLITRCDVLLNPHSPIEHMANGVFPFKVIEAIASGRLLLSTPLPQVGLTSVLQGVRFIEHDIDALTDAVLDSRDWFGRHASQVVAGSEAAATKFSKSSILYVVEDVLEGAVS